MSYYRYRILWMVGCLLFVVGCTAVPGEVEPPADLNAEIADTTTNSELSDLTIAEEVEEEAAHDTAQTVMDMLKANLTSQSLASLDYSVPSYSLPDCAYSVEEPIVLTYVEEETFHFVEETPQYIDDITHFNYIEAISETELFMSGATAYHTRWLGIYDTLSKQIDILYEVDTGLHNLQWSHQYNGAFFTEGVGQLKFLHKYATTTVELYEDIYINTLGAVDRGKKLSLSASVTS